MLGKAKSFPLCSRLGVVLDVKVNQVVEYLNVAHFDAGVLEQLIADFIHALIDAYRNALGSHYTPHRRNATRAIMVPNPINVPQINAISATDKITASIATAHSMIASSVSFMSRTPCLV